MAEDTGLFQINDQVLNIPPESIQVDRKSYNNQWQTLRTRSSIKVKSGFSSLDIYITVKFTDDTFIAEGEKRPTNGLRKLRNLISQFRVTPFCFVENQFLRNSILGGESQMNMALALKNIEIMKGNDSTNCVTVNMAFSWFNYFPYTKTFTFKEDIFSPIEVRNPAESRAWKLMYQAEQTRNLYLEIDKLDPSFPTVLGFNQFAQVTLSRYNQLKKEVGALRALRDELITLSNDDNDVDNVDVTSRIRQRLLTELQSEDQANGLIFEVFGHTTTMYQSGDPVADALGLISKNIDPGTNSQFGIIVDSDQWLPIILADAKPVVFKNEIAAKRLSDKDKEKQEEFNRSDVVLMGRQRSLNLNSSGLVVTSISISFGNILSTMPVIGHPFPSYQHIGSTDGRISLSIMTTSEESVKALSGFYSMMEEQAHRYRAIPAGHRNVSIANDLVNMCGLQDMLPESLVISTVEGLPGTYAAELVLIDNPLNADTVEKIIPAQTFNNANSIRKKIVEVLQKNVKIVPNAFTRTRGIFGLLGGSLTMRDLEDGEFLEENLETGYYQYAGPANTRNDRFKELCVKYGKNLGNLLEKVFPYIANLKELPLNAPDLGFRPEDFFQLTSDDVLGVEKVQDDIRPIISKLKSQNSKDPLLGELGVENPIIREAKKKSQVTDAFFDSYNKINEAKQSSVLSDSGREETIKEVFAELDFTRNDQRISMLMNKFMMDWMAFVVEFVDKIRLDGSLELDEFKEVQTLLMEIPVSSAALSYPDFPLVEVLSLMSTANDPGLKASYEKLKDLFQKTDLSNRDINMAALLNPDFYFFNPQNDLINEIMPTQVINSARDSIKAARKSQEQVESDYFKKIYDKTLISPEKAAKVYIQMGVTDSNLSKAGESDPGVLSALTNWITRLGAAKTSCVAPNYLIGSVGPSIEETKKNNKDNKPITIKARRAGSDQNNVYNNYNADTTLRGPQFSEQVKHRFDADSCLDYLSEGHYVAPIVSNDPNTLPTVSWPTLPDVQYITSKFGPRIPPAEGASSFHKGIDIASAIRGTCDGQPVLAAADGTISFVSYSQTERKPGEAFGHEGVAIQIIHNGGLVTHYFHLKWDDIISDLSDKFHRKGKYKHLSDASRKTALLVNRGDRIASIGNTGHGTGSHLHFETFLNGQPQDPTRIIDGDFNPSRSIVAGIDPNNESLLKKSIDQLEKDLRNGQGYSMNRAYPTFKLYFIESDMGERKRFQFDDFFSYSSVKEIQVIRSRKIAADLCIIQLTNVSGVLSNRKFQSAIDPTSMKDVRGQPATEQPGSPQRVNTEFENPIASLMLQPGIQIQLRLGYSNNPEELETMFNGVITDVQFTENDDLVEITCQSFAIELIQTIQGEVKKFGGFLGGILSGDSRTEVILNELLSAPEVVHFGRWEGNSTGNHQDTSTIAESLSNKWKMISTPQDDNLFPPQGQALSWFRAMISSEKYIMYNTTIWDVFEEMTMRHPSYITSAVPYEGREGPRMTMFFGLPDQLYFARDPSAKEENTIKQLKGIIEDNKQASDGSEKARQDLLDHTSTPGAEVLANAMEETEDNNSAQQRKEWFKALAKQYATDKGFIKPFRAYHVLTSSLHIMKNSISSSGHNTFNTVTVQYSGSSPAENKDTGEVNFGNLKTFTLKGDAAIRDEEIRETLQQFPNCVGEEVAKCYAMSVLFNSLKDAYGGTIEIIGNPRIKPYDVCYVFDEYTDMFGPVEVEQVVHKISQETGFITEITPDLMVHVNQWATISTSDAMGLMAENALKSIGLQSLGSIVGNQQVPLAQAVNADGSINLAAAVALAPVTLASGFNSISSLFFNSSNNSIGTRGSGVFGQLGLFMFRKLITRTQLAHPFRFSPLVLGGKPMVGGLPNRHVDGTFLQIPGQFIRQSADDLPLLLEDTRDRMNPSNWWGYLGQGDIASSLVR